MRRVTVKAFGGPEQLITAAARFRWRGKQGMIDSLSEAVVAAFLRTALADAALSVPKLEEKARASGLLGEHQRVTHAKLFKRAKKSLGIRSTRAGFGTGGEWLWELPSKRDESAVSPSISPLPACSGHRIPVDWVQGVACLVRPYFRSIRVSITPPYDP